MELAEHIKGFVAVPVIEICRAAGLFTRVQPGKRFAAGTLAAQLRLQPDGFARALRVLESIGWAEAIDARHWRLNAPAGSCEQAPPPALRLLSSTGLLQADTQLSPLLTECLALQRRRWDVRDPAFAGLLDGLLLLPLLHALRQNPAGANGESLVDVLQHLLPATALELEAFFTELRWVERTGAALLPTPAGEHGWRAAADAALLLRHAPVLAALDRVLAVGGAGWQATAQPADDPRIEAMWPAIEKSVLAAFDQLPVAAQPQYLACWHLGAARVARLAAAIHSRTRRGRMLDAHPLLMLAVHSKAEHETIAASPEGLEIRLVEGDCLTPELAQCPPDTGLHLVNLPGRRMLADRPTIDHAQLLSAWMGVASAHGCVLIEEHGREQHAVALPHDAASATFERSLETLQQFDNLHLHSADEWLMAAAGCGLFPQAGAGVGCPGALPLTRWGMHRFEPRDYRIRPARGSDLPALMALEQLCWGSELAATETTVRERMRRHPDGQMALDIGGRLGGAMYSQRIHSREDVVTATARTAIKRHAPDGLIVQLLAVNVQPELQDRRLGDQLLEFMLHRCAVLDGVRTVLAVTRCKDYPQHRDVDPASYLRLRNERGSLVDSVLRFHELHGASIEQLVPRYRPKDSINLGNGVLVAYDIRHRARDEISVNAQADDVDAERSAPAAIARDVAQHILALLAEPESFAVSRPLIEMGLDSADLLQLTEALSHRYKITLGSSFFFEFNTCASVVQELAARLGQRVEEPQAAPAAAPLDTATDGHEPVAIVGLAFRLPGGIADLDALWTLLIEGRDAIGTLPRERWRWPASINPTTAHQGIDRCGVMRDVGHFDAAFFRLSPREAELMDPQQRILLELAWQCVEDAGYQPSELAGGATGVYVGASGSDYQCLLQQQPEVAAQYGLAKSMAILANRISYFFDFQGPSLQIDTACSSSLVAIHQAVHALRDGTCTHALVAGINLMADPSTTIAYYKAGMLSKDGLCRTFDAGADGYVRSEGAVTMLLKPLAQARRDGDHVYALIRGGAVNHGGRAGGLTVPHPIRQAELLVEAYADAAVDPQRLKYIEAHGTGTPLGDPVEVQGIKEALRRMGGADSAPHVCGVGSVKTNLGHLEAAAGMAGMLKVLLGMRHRMLPGNAHFRSLNPKIDLGDSALFVVDHAQAWRSDCVGPMLAGVSSFGSGGTNAHVVLEEAPPAAPVQASAAPVLLPLSAATRGQVRQYAASIAAFIRRAAPDLAALCHTMQVGRTPMRARVVFLAAQRDALLRQLDAYAAGQSSIEGVVEAPELMASGSPVHVGLSEDASAKEISRACLAWVQGADVDWQALHGKTPPVRISLPTYPFAREYHWVEPAAPAAAVSESLHPLVQRNTSTLAGLRFSTHLDGNDFVLRDHVVFGRQVLPGAAHLELARAALTLVQDGAAEGMQLVLRDVVFLRPAAAGVDGLDLHIVLSGESDYEISGGDDVVYSRGRARMLAPAPAQVIDLAGLEAQCERSWDVADCYAAFDRAGLSYGPGFRGLAALRSGRDADGDLTVARLALPPTLFAQPAYLLHPSLIDAAIQAGLASTLGQGRAGTLLPFALEQLEIWSAVPAQAAVVVRRSAGQDGSVFKLDLTITDDTGRVCARLAGLSCREMQGEVAAAPLRTLLAAPRWISGGEPADGAGHDRHLVVLCEVDEGASRWSGASIHRMQADMANPLAQRYETYAEQLLQLARNAGNALVQLVVSAEGEGDVLRGLFALLKSAAQENPQLKVQLLTLGSGGLEAVEQGFEPEHILEEGVPVSRQGPPLAREGGVYLITGGLGGVGMLLAQAIASQATDITLVLTGRRAADDASLQTLRRLGARVDYLAIDVSDAAGVQTLMQHVATHHGVLTGVVHGAGVLRDGFLLHKTVEQLRDVLAPKVRGLQLLDEATRDQPLDYFVALSSVAGVFGNVGQADYAAANAFMDGYLRQRAMRVKQGMATGRTLSVNWPLWADGGMHIDAATLQRMQRSTGMAPLPTAAALQALEVLLSGDESQSLVLHGDVTQLASSLLRTPGKASLTSQQTAPAMAPAASVTLPDALRDQARRWVSEVLARRLKLPMARIDATAPVERYGIDSIMMTELVDQFEQSFGALPKTLFFEHGTVDALVAYFASHHYERLTGLLGVDAAPPQPAINIPVQTAVAVPRLRPDAPRSSEIAIIGTSGRYPQAADLDQFWANLQAGRDCITEVPAERWDSSAYFDARKGMPGKSYCNWGGFIDGVDQFDAALFNLAPRDAAALDPQCRIFLELTWELLEQSAYTADALRTRHPGRVGLYVGSMYQQYRSSYPETVFNPAMQITSFSAMANRVSSYFGFEGPSVALDTMCSSSAMAIHMACQALASGECSVAVAGGVNLSIHPYKFVGLSQWQLLGSHAASRSFSDGDGYLPAEGAGAVLLKPLADAQRDGDTILAVIKGTATRHSGHSSSYMQPNLQTQAGVMAAAMAQAGVEAGDIGYVEAAANGGALGDAIEVLALKKVFAGRTQRLPLGSVKSGIGHAEAASGISQLTKLVLQLRHRQLAPTVMPGRPNPNIDFNNGPFQLQTELAQWEPGAAAPVRRALVNSFGAGGTCVSMVVEEYVATPSVAVPSTGPQIVVLSALSRQPLLAHAQRLLQHVEAHTELALADIAITLQRSRQPMRMRLAWVAADREGLLAGLRAFLAGTELPTLHSADIDNLPEAVGRLLTGAVSEAVVEQLLAQRDLDALALYWSQGGTIPWEQLTAGSTARAVALPTYPFDRQRHWVPLVTQEASSVSPVAPPAIGIPEAVLAAVADVLGLAPDSLPASRTLRQLGFNSIHALTLKHTLERSFGCDIPAATLADPRQSAGQVAAAVEALVGTLAGSAAPTRQLVTRPDERYQPFPLTDVQEAFYVGRALDAAGEGATIYFELELGNGVDMALLSATWERLIARHDMLRAVIDADGSQRVLEQVPGYRIRIADWRRMDAATRAQSHAALRERMEQHSPDAAKWPRFDIRVSLHDAGRQVLHFSIDELIADGPSAYQLMREWAQACQADWTPAPLEATFRDYVFALKEQEDQPAAAADLAYWIERLDHLPAAPALPLNQASGTAHRRKRLVHQVAPEQRALLEEKANAAGVSLTVLLLSLFSELLRTWSASPDFTLVLTYANRLPLHPQVPEIVGPAISTAFFVADAAPGASFDELAQSYQHSLWESLDHMRVSGVRVLRELKARKRVPQGATFPVVFTSMLNSASAPAGGWPISYTLNQTPQVFLDHQVLDLDGASQLSWDVADGYFAPGLVEQMFDAYRSCLNALGGGRREWTRDLFSQKAVADVRGLRIDSRPEAAGEPFPLSDQQNAYAFGRAARTGEGSGLSCQYYQEIDTGALDLDRLSRAWAGLMARHPMLRAIVGSDGTQRVLPQAPSWQIASADLSALDTQARSAALDTIRHQMVERNAPLDSWPFFEVRVSRLSAASCRIHLTLDMLIADGSSIVQVLNELLAAYQYPERSLPVPALSFRDYQMALQAFRGSAAHRDSLAYWNAKFAALPNGPRLTGAGHWEGGGHARVEGMLTAWPALREQARGLGVTPDVILLAAYLEVLSERSGRTPLTVVVPNWDRLPVHADVGHVVGDFTALAWVAHDGARLSMRDRVLDVAAQLNADLAQRPVSGLSALRRRVLQQGGQALRFPVVFTAEMPRVALPADGQWSVSVAQSKTPGVHLDNISAERDGALHCAWDYLPSIYPQHLVEPMFQAYLQLLSTLAADPAAWQATPPAAAVAAHWQPLTSHE